MAQRVREGKMKPEQADKEIALMTAVLATLNGLLRNWTPQAIAKTVEDREMVLDREAAAEYLSQVLAAVSGLCAAAIGLPRTHALLDQCKNAARQVLDEFRKQAH